MYQVLGNTWIFFFQQKHEHMIFAERLVHTNQEIKLHRESSSLHEASLPSTTRITSASTEAFRAGGMMWQREIMQVAFDLSMS